MKGHFFLLLLATAIITAWDSEKQKKTSEDKFGSHKKNRNEQSAHYGMSSEASRFFRCYDYRITLLLRHSFFTDMKDWPAKIYICGFLNTCKFLEP